MPIPDQDRPPEDDEGGQDDATSKGTTAEDLALLLVRLVAVPFLVVGVIVWCLAFGVVMVTRWVVKHLARIGWGNSDPIKTWLGVGRLRPVASSDPPGRSHTRG